MSLWVTILGMLVSSVISVIFSDTIIQGIRKTLFHFGILKDINLSGTWIATFYMNNKKAYQEVIKLHHKVGLVFGYIEPDSRNYEKLQQVMYKKPMRIKGSINDNRYFTGFWYHPIEQYRHHGSYQLLIHSTAIKMEGQWIGFSETSKIISHGKWEWEKISNN